jgi:hypothetical protein
MHGRGTHTAGLHVRGCGGVHIEVLGPIVDAAYANVGGVGGGRGRRSMGDGKVK